MPGKIRGCVACGQHDDHPRHVIATPAGSVAVHMDCHAAMGCAKCAATVGTAENLKGDELRDHIRAGGAADAVAAVMEEIGNG
jgi:hypothetical protein